jgi:16S rRNA G966 N2-methylase RsmD
MKLDSNILKRLPLALRIELVENTQRLPLAQSELAAEQRRVLVELRKHAKPGTRTDRAETGAKDFAQVNRATRLVGELYGESHRQVEKRLAVVEAAETEPERFGPLVEHMDRSGKVERAYAELRRVQVEEAEAVPVADGIEAEVIVGDFRSKGHAVADNSTDLIFTDAPYADWFVPQFADLAQFGARVLIPGGSLLVYPGIRSLDKVMALMTPHLEYFWTIALVHSSNERRRVPGPYVGNGYHLVLWFTKGQRRRRNLVSDCLRTDPGNKIVGHAWAQGTAEATYYIKQLSRRGSRIVDPFLGSGTTGVAALKAGRNFVGFEIDPPTARKAEARIKRLQTSDQEGRGR